MKTSAGCYTVHQVVEKALNCFLNGMQQANLKEFHDALLTWKFLKFLLNRGSPYKQNKTKKKKEKR